MPGKPEAEPNEKRIAQAVAAARQDPRAFGELYLLYAQPVFRYLFHRIGSLPEAEDVTAQTFLAALERFPDYRHNGHFASWLFAIARNKVIDYFRAQQKQTPLAEAELVPDEANPLHEVIQTERIAALSKLIRSLPEEEQELIRLRYVAELSFSEIGHLLRRKEDAVKKSLYRLLARLKAQLEDDHVG